jgi:predicted RNase H-like nuclease
MKVAGADVWKGKWVVVVLDDGQFEGALVASTIEAAVAGLPDATAIGVDMPIGLPDPGRRRPADEQARKYVGPRWQSVFMTPCVSLLLAPSLAEANQLAVAEGWDGISAQAYALGKLILQVQPVADRDARVFEIHPEVSFVQANRDAPLQWSKSSWNGFALRRRILQDHGIVIGDDTGKAGAAGVADVLDAAIAAWSAGRIASGQGRSLPDGADRIGAIWA